MYDLKTNKVYFIDFDSFRKYGEKFEIGGVLNSLLCSILSSDSRYEGCEDKFLEAAKVFLKKYNDIHKDKYPFSSYAILGRIQRKDLAGEKQLMYDRIMDEVMEICEIVV